MSKTVTRKKSKPIRKLSDKQRLDELQGFVSLCFGLLSDVSMVHVANRTGLHLSTVYRLFEGNYTLKIRFNTIQVLAYAAGLKLTLTENDVTVDLV